MNTWVDIGRCYTWQGVRIPVCWNAVIFGDDACSCADAPLSWKAELKREIREHKARIKELEETIKEDL